MGKVISTVGAVIASPFGGKFMGLCNKCRNTRAFSAGEAIEWTKRKKIKCGYNLYGALHPNLGHFGSGCDGFLEVCGGYASAGRKF